MKQTKLTLDSENLVVDWLSFNLEGFMDPGMLVRRLSKHFTPHVLIDNVPSIEFHGLKKKYKVSVPGLELRLFSLEKMRLIFISLSKLKGLIGVF